MLSFPSFLRRTLQLQQRHDGPAQADNLKAKLTEAENKFMPADSKAFTLCEKTDLLEKQLKASELSFFNAKASVAENREQRDTLCSQLHELENVTADLKEKLSEAEKESR